MKQNEMNQSGVSGMWVVGLLLVVLLGALSWGSQISAETPSITTMSETTLSVEQVAAQQIVLASRAVENLSAGTEVFQIAPVVNFRPKQRELCAESSCYQVDSYDYATGATTTTVVDVISERVLDSWRIDNSRPIFSAAVGERAKTLLRNNADLTAAIGRPIHPNEIALMDGQHDQAEGCDGRDLCLTSVFVVDSGMVWATVNMQRNEVAAIWWTSRSTDGAEANKRDWDTSSEQRGNLCGDVFNHTANGWSVNYEVTRSDGLHAFNVQYQGETVIDSLKLVEIHVDYTVQDSSPTFNGFVDYLTCGVPGSGHIPPFGSPEIRPIVEMSQTVGFEVYQDFRQSSWGFTCRYRYDQRYQFFNDGRWRSVTGAYGRGCGDALLSEAIYRPVMRLDLTAAMVGERLDYWNGSGWSEQTEEAWFGEGQAAGVEAFSLDSNGYAFRIHDGISGYFIEPSNGQFNDGGTGDDAWLYLTKFQTSEGSVDLSTIGGCCNSTHQQGPQNFINGEVTSGENTVIWYVPDQDTVTSYGATLPPGDPNYRADDAYCWADREGSGNTPTTLYPCNAGPMFVPWALEPTAVGLAGERVGNSAEIMLIFALTVGLSGSLFWLRRS